MEETIFVIVMGGLESSTVYLTDGRRAFDAPRFDVVNQYPMQGKAENNSMSLKLNKLPLCRTKRGIRDAENAERHT